MKKPEPKEPPIDPFKEFHIDMLHEMRAYLALMPDDEKRKAWEKRLNEAIRKEREA